MKAAKFPRLNDGEHQGTLYPVTSLPGQIGSRFFRALHLICCGTLFLVGGRGLGQDNARERTVESIVPWLSQTSSCRSVVELENLGDREVAAEVEAHARNGALVPFADHGGINVRLRAREHAEDFECCLHIRETISRTPVDSRAKVIALLLPQYGYRVHARGPASRP